MSQITPDEILKAYDLSTASKLTVRQVELIQKGVDVLVNAGDSFLTTFYDTMLHENPALLNIFNKTHQRTLAQPRALARVVAAYATNLDHIKDFLPTLYRVSQKHVSLCIGPESYPIVGKYLLRTMKKVLGPDLANAEFCEAWNLAYEQLANLFIELESMIYKENVDAIGGWKGFRVFTVVDKVHETRNVMSIRIKPRDGKRVIIPQAGQSIGIRFRLPGHVECRQYSVSEHVTSGTDGYQISVKHLENGKVSGYVHEELRLGDVVDVAAPSGHFLLRELQPKTRKILLIAAGIGVTPLVSMSRQALDSGAEVTLVHCDYNKKMVPFYHHFMAMADIYDNFDYQTYYSSTGVRFGKRDLERLLRYGDTDMYVVGPIAFMQDMRKHMNAIEASRKMPNHNHTATYEFFGPAAWE